jgi:hypothetical protein
MSKSKEKCLLVRFGMINAVDAVCMAFLILTLGVSAGCVCTWVDQDCDSVVDLWDNCPNDYNPDQADYDADGFADAWDNCPYVANDSQVDEDKDGIGDPCEDYVLFSDLTDPSAPPSTLEIGAPFWDKIMIKNRSTEPITIIRPNCVDILSRWRESDWN